MRTHVGRRTRITAVIAFAFLIAGRLTGVIDHVAAAWLLAIAISAALIGCLRRAIGSTTPSRWIFVAAATSGACAAVAHAIGTSSGAPTEPLATTGALIALVLASWALLLEAIPLIPIASRTRAILDSFIAATLLTAIAWNILLVIHDHDSGFASHVLLASGFFLLLLPTSLAAAAAINDPTDRRPRRISIGFGAMFFASMAGHVVGHASAVVDVAVLSAGMALALAVSTENNGNRPSINIPERLRRRRRANATIHVIYVVSLLVAMTTASEHRLMGSMTVLALIMVLLAQTTSNSENLRLTRRLAGRLDELTVSEERFRGLAGTDELTGLMNRRAFVTKVDLQLQRHHDCSVLFVDLDRFKEVNDSLGHDAGDDLLIQLGRRIESSLNGVATVARFGGDEFIVLVPDTPTDRAAVACGERILAALAEPVMLDGIETFVAASVGVVRANPESTSATLLSDADAAMYAAKARGRNRVVVFSQELRSRVESRLNLANELHRAIEFDELRVHYQPILRLDDATVSGFEALVRWQHPTRGLLAPGEFLDIADDTGLIVPLGATVLTAACQQLSQWIREGLVDSTTTVAVNLAPRQLGDPAVIALVADALVDSGLPATNLVLELTESALMSDAPEVDSIVAALSELGVRFSVDDFGTGYSSLTYLKRFPVHVLKVDRDFVDGLPHDDGDAVIVKAVVSLAAGMGFTCVAEGVEQPEQADYLRSIGCSHAQGYLFAKPMPADELRTWAASRTSDAITPAGICPGGPIAEERARRVP